MNDSNPKGSDWNQLINLPPEVLHLVVSILPVHSLSSLTQSSKALNAYIDHVESSQHLWKAVGSKRWDLPSSTSGWKAADIEADRKWKGKSFSKLKDLEEGEKPKEVDSDEWVTSDEIKRRSKAVGTIKRGGEDEGIAILNHSSTLKSLLSILRSRAPRQIYPSYPNSSLPSSKTTSSLSSIFSKSTKGDERWSKFIYPRETISSLEDWGMKLLADDPAIRSRARDPPNESFSSSPSKPERRSTRLSYNNYPLGLHTLLKKGWLPSEVDEIAIRQVRDGGKDKTINEELAAQIHCLHGVRKFSLETSKTQRIGNGDLAVDVQGKGKEKCGKQSRRDSFSSFSSQEDESDSQASLAEKSISSKVGDDGTFPALPLFGPHDANQVQPSQTIITDGLLGTQAQVQVHAQPGGMAEDDNEQATPEPAPWYDFVAPDAQRAASYNLGSKNGGIGDSRLRTKARERVYDASRYSYENGWGPFKAWRESEESWRRRKEEGSDAVGVKEKYIKGKEKAAEVAENIEDESDEEDFVGVGTSEEEEIQTEEEGEDNDEDGDSLRREVQREFSITPAATLASPPPVSHASSSNGTRALPSLASVLDFAVAASMENYDSEDDPDFQPEAATPPTLNIDPTVSTNPDLILDAGDPEEDELSMMQIFQDNSDGEEIVVEEDDFFDDGDTDSDDEEAFGGLHIGHFGQTRQTLRDWAGSRVREELGGKIQKSQAQVKEKGKGKERAIEREGSDGLMKFQKTIDWQQLEAIMLVTYTNLQSALREGWGRGFDLPIGVYGDQSANPPPKFPSSIPQDGVKTKGQLQDEADQLDLIKKFERRRRLLIPRSDFENSRGEILLDEEIREDQEKRNENDEMTESLGSNKDVKGSQNRGKGKEKEIKEEKPKDWAHVEGVHVGTYSFLDFSDFLIFNAALGSQAEEAAVAAQSSCQETGSSSQASSSINPRSWLRSNTASLSIMRQAITLEGKEEAVGDCLNLELELLPLSSQPGFEKDEDGFKSKTPDEQIEDDLVGKDDRYPPLRFKGRTLTQNGLTSIPRGEAHGLVRPIYAPGERIGGSSNASSSPKEIVGIHWTVVHRYDGEDRWRLELIQPGCAGARSPMYGTWTSAEHEDSGPTGPASYYRVDSRRWDRGEEKQE